MNGDDKNENVIEGTTERKTEIVRVGNRIIKTSIYEEQINEEGVLERRNIEEKTPLDCGHVENPAGECPVCHRFFCQVCVSRHGTCFVCGGVACPTCSDSTVLDKDKKYHRTCFWESVRRKILG